MPNPSNPSSPQTLTNAFNYTDAVASVCEHMTARLPEFAMIQMPRVGISFNRTRRTGSVGVWASLTPLKFEQGREFKTSRGQLWKMPTLIVQGRTQPLLYLLSIYIPRFFDLSLTDKIETLVHELYHISPLFNGDIRRFAGRNYAHGSKNQYNASVKQMAKRWLATDPDPELWRFLQYDSKSLYLRYPKVIGCKIVPPSPERVVEPSSFKPLIPKRG